MIPSLGFGPNSNHHPSFATTRNASSKTKLAMFDWFNKQKPAEEAATKGKESDFLSNFFNQASPLDVDVPSAPKVEETPSPPTTTMPEAKNEIYHGTVQWFDRNKGYGFIVPEVGSIAATSGKTVFVHQSDILCSGFRFLFDGEDVEYRLKEDTQGRFNAIDVTGPGGGPLLISRKRELNGKKKRS